MRTGATSKRRWGITAAAAVLGILAAWSWRASMSRDCPRQGQGPNVLLIVLDSLRADRPGFAGGARNLTPFLDELAARSTVYERAYAPSSWTVPVVASLLTGQYPSEHGATNFFAKVNADAETLPDLLAACGWATSAVSANAALREKAGFARGFERYATVGEPTFLDPTTDGSVVNAQVLEWVDEVGPEQPHFLYLHYMDVHMPYRDHGWVGEAAGPPMRSSAELNLALVRGAWDFSPREVQRLKNLYDGEVRHQDAVLRELFAQLDRRGFLRNALVVITADHGEEFGGHGVFGHGASLHETAVHVPLLIQFPTGAPGRVHQPVQLTGIAAKILKVAGVSRPDSVRVPPVPRRPAAAPGRVFTELIESGQKDHWLHAHAVVAGDAKLVMTPDGTRVAYDLAADPRERAPVPPADADLAAALDARLALIVGGADPAGAEHTPLDDTVAERLRALGYLVE